MFAWSAEFSHGFKKHHWCQLSYEEWVKSIVFMEAREHTHYIIKIPVLAKR